MVIDVRFVGETTEGFTHWKIYEQAILVSNDTLLVRNDHDELVTYGVPGAWKKLFIDLGVHGSAIRKEGLYNKYQIINRETGAEVEGNCFVLRPDRDPAAREALMAYAEVTDNHQLAMDITVWVSSLPEVHS